MKKRLLITISSLISILIITQLNVISAFAVTQDEMIQMIEESCEKYGIDIDDLSTTGGTANDKGGEALTRKLEEMDSQITENKNSNSTQQVIKVPVKFTVDDCEEINGWSIKKCNIRKGASTEYEIVGSLQENEKIVITGVASTGWYRIKTDTLEEVYVSNTLITKENPNVISEEPTTTEEETTVEPTTEETTTIEEETSIEEITTVEEITTIEEQTTTEEETTIEEIPINYTNWYIIGGVALVVTVITVIAITRRKHK